MSLAATGTAVGAEAGDLLVISRSEVEEMLTPAKVIKRCEEVFAWVGAGEVEQVNPVNLYVHDRLGPEPPYGHGAIQAFPAMIRPLERAAVKWLSSFRKNPLRGLPAISALDLLTDTATGMPLALLDGTSVTNMRTGGHAAVGAKFLARPDSATLAIIGCGNEGRTHLACLADLFDLREVLAFDVQAEALRRFLDYSTEVVGVDATAVRSVEEAAARADIICVVTTSPAPVLFERWVPEGAHVCAATGFRDVEFVCATSFEKWVVGYYGRDLAWIEGEEVGRIGGVLPEQLSRGDIHADIAGEILPGLKPGRENEVERTIMTHMGMASLDAGVASLAYDLAVEAGAGQRVRVF